MKPNEYEEATVRIFFEKDKACCAYCPLMTETPRPQCRRTGSYIVDKMGRDRWCPLEFK